MAPRPRNTPAKRRTAKRTKVPLGSAEVNASDLKSLRYAWRHRQLVLFLGAGVSVPYGLPSWRNLVLELLFEQADTTRRLGHIWPHYRRAVAAWMADYFEYDPLVLARMVEHYLKKPRGAQRKGATGAELFLERLRKHLYTNLRKPTSRTILQTIAGLAERTTMRTGLDGIVTFNFDDLLEQELKQRDVRHTPVTGSKRQHGAGLRVLHAHGYVPQQGPLSRQDIVFTEPDYHALTESLFHWSLSEIVERLRKSTVLFVGLSMSDPSLRRLLDVSVNSDIPPHFQIQKRHEIRDHELREVTSEVERRARDYAAVMGLKANNRPEDLKGAINATLKQADTYDREVFETMGVKTIWVNDFGAISDVLEGVPG
jgi:hypothetical protein